MAPIGLKHWMLHNDRLAKEYDETLKLSPGFDPVRAVDPALTFHAPLTTGPDSMPGALRAIFLRNSEATYQAPRGAFLLSALDDEPRHEYTPNDEPLGVLLEPATTNKCENYNANPDPALEGLTDVSGTGTVERVNQAAALERAGLNRVCRDGNVIRITETSGVSAFAVRANGGSGNLNLHTAQIYGRVIEGEGRLNLTGGGVPFTEFTNTEFELIELLKEPFSDQAALQVQAQPDSVVEFVLNQYEEDNVRSSVIVTQGAATSRAVEQLSWPLMGDPHGSILNQSEGMAAILWRPSFSDGDLPVNTSQSGRLLRLGVGQAQLFGPVKTAANENRFSSFDGVSNVNVYLVAPWVKEQWYAIAVRWNSGVRELGYKTLGAWQWASGGYAGAWPESGILELSPFDGQINRGIWARDLHMWSEDRGAAWLESFFEGVAN